MRCSWHMYYPLEDNVLCTDDRMSLFASPPSPIQGFPPCTRHLQLEDSSPAASTEPHSIFFQFAGPPPSPPRYPPISTQVQLCPGSVFLLLPVIPPSDVIKKIPSPTSSTSSSSCGDTPPTTAECALAEVVPFCRFEIGHYICVFKTAPKFSSENDAV